MGGATRFDCYPSDFLNGIIGLSSDEIATYTVVLMMQYDRGAPVAYVGRERELSVRAGLPKGRLARAVEGLVASGKLVCGADGCLHNERTERELEKIREKIQKNIENSHEGGKATQRKWDGIRKENKEPKGPTGMPNGMPKQGPLPSPSPSPEETEAKASVVRTKKTRSVFEYPDDFSQFWSAYPTDANMSKQETYGEWNKLSAEDREKALASCRPFRTYCASRPDYRTVHANRYLSQGRFHGHAAVAAEVSKTVFVRVGSPQWRAWEIEYRRTRGQSPPVNKEGSGWHFPTEYPGSENEDHVA